ncbi:MAG: NADH-quinone oxidoreductase subunit L [Planctomycetota bacterium]|jgi:NADH-quinone oxidoreductase subunit L
MEFDPELDYKLLLAVPLIPLIGYVVQIFFGRHLPRKGDWMLTSGMFVVMGITVYMFAKVAMHALGHHGEEGEQAAAWFVNSAADGGPTFGWLYSSAVKEAGSGLGFTAGIMYDGLGATMLLVVGVVSFFVHLFSCGYMHGDRRYHIFFANISLFTFAMLGLVLSDNLLFLFVFWELMGLMSYLLIGHFSQDPDSHRIKQAANACKKAFMTTRVGDTCLLFGMAIFYFHFKTFSFTEMWAAAQATVAANGGEYPAWMTLGGLFIFGGTVGKSAQFPLHIWLPDAMEGPTPVSAMIHAATMVAAGVFLLGRCFPLFSPEVLEVITVTGSVTAIFAATIGCTVNDIKGVLAYSTISQLGFMVAAIGTGGLGLIAGLFHMVTHAFFKACLFLSAGSVIHGCHHEQDMRKMGGLRSKMPLTFIAMFVCTLAIAGMPFFSGFYSKDRIIAATWEAVLFAGSPSGVVAAVLLPLAAMLTAFYMFRLIFMTFFGTPRDHCSEHAHESPLPMTISLLVLATLGMLGGCVWFLEGWNPHHTWFTHMISEATLYPGIDLSTMNHPVVDEHTAHTAHSIALAVSVFVMLSGIWAAWKLYIQKRVKPALFVEALGPVYTLIENKYYIDEGVDFVVIKGTLMLSAVQKWIDENIVDGAVNGVGKLSKVIALICAWIDSRIVDGMVNGVAGLSQVLGSVVRLFQTGRVQQYVSFAVAGGIALAAGLILF